MLGAWSPQGAVLGGARPEPPRGPPLRVHGSHAEPCVLRGDPPVREERVHRPTSGTLSRDIRCTVSQAWGLRPSGKEMLCQAAGRRFLFPECSLALRRQGQGLCPPGK